MNSVIGFPGLNPNNGEALPTPYAQGAGARPLDTRQLGKAQTATVLFGSDVFTAVAPSPTFLAAEGDFIRLDPSLSIGAAFLVLNASPSNLSATLPANFITLLPGESYRGPFKGIAVYGANPSLLTLTWGWNCDVTGSGKPSRAVSPRSAGAVANISTYTASLQISASGTAEAGATLLTANSFASNRGSLSAGGVVGCSFAFRMTQTTANYLCPPSLSSYLRASGGQYAEYVALTVSSLSTRESGADTIVEMAGRIPDQVVLTANTGVDFFINANTANVATSSWRCHVSGQRITVR